MYQHCQYYNPYQPKKTPETRHLADDPFMPKENKKRHINSIQFIYSANRPPGPIKIGLPDIPLTTFDEKSREREIR